MPRVWAQRLRQSTRMPIVRRRDSRKGVFLPPVWKLLFQGCARMSILPLSSTHDIGYSKYLFPAGRTGNAFCNTPTPTC